MKAEAFGVADESSIGSRKAKRLWRRDLDLRSAPSNHVILDWFVRVCQTKRDSSRQAP